jgi:quercetin dioxygenase-like cupin family protein
MTADRLPPPPLRERLLRRVTESARASRQFVTVRARGAVAQTVGEGVVARSLYQAKGAAEGPMAASRPGEPRRVRVVELSPGSRWTPGLHPGDQAEWLVLAGTVCLAGEQLSPLDYHWAPPGAPPPMLLATTAARVLLREAPASPQAGGQCAFTRADAATPWDDFAPGIQRRVLWASNGEAALLYRASAGAQVPGHGHQRDEECLMVEGEVFLGDVLLLTGDYQLAPAGTAHSGVSTDTGGLIFAHGDLDLDLHGG